MSLSQSKIPMPFGVVNVSKGSLGHRMPAHKSFCKEHIMNRSLTKMNLKHKEDHPDDLQLEAVADRESEKKRAYPPVRYSKKCDGCSKNRRQLLTPKDCQSCCLAIPRMRRSHFKVQTHITVLSHGRECQKRDWPHHKFVCQTNSIARKEEYDYPEMSDDVLKFADTFKYELLDAAVYCLNLQKNLHVWKTRIFEVHLVARRISDLNEPGLERMLNHPGNNPISDRPLLRVALKTAPANARRTVPVSWPSAG
ncbi:hypothetical protein DFH08DRAFT_933524 [Mycena albidolilacea]|uniref:MYND-type domain-containing protein n=1 Tax=Mycena albidolilacea TaxID=1033008 RepID=A0AAD7EWZ3_9AGAR|nr:hypothetical protein DFH08DRAFT_933524 [Mycena albidolilacea]